VKGEGLMELRHIECMGAEKENIFLLFSVVEISLVLSHSEIISDSIR
jgi:hypothetical protein